jgi:uncharacterized protein YprB with RNaseH-like and TPR domain/Holliday junction resolvase-like predicted endonuclease
VVKLSLKGKLNRFKQHLTVEKVNDVNRTELGEKRVSERSPERLPDAHIPFLDQWKELQASPYFFDSEHIIRRDVHYPLHYKHGKYPFSMIHEVVEAWNEKKVTHPLSSYSYGEKDLLFFDTETTGLGGGVGNTIFLLGYGKITDNSLQVTQLFLPSPVSEVAFYHHFLEDIAEMQRLITYNGKAFDWPQVKTRHTLIRDELPKLPSFGHFDLLHASRRLWKNELPSCRLSVIEEKVLDFKRSNDTPGYMAPILYFEYLKSKDPGVISGVFQHNEWDICSLVTLYTHISLLLLDLNESNLSMRESLEIGRWYEAIGELDLAIHQYKKALVQDGNDNMYGKSLLAMVYKKQRHYSLAAQLWEDISSHHSLTIDVDLELAKVNEHHQGDLEKALHYAKKAFQTWNNTRRLANREEDRHQRSDFMKRIQRLEKKMTVNGVEQDSLF